MKVSRSSRIAAALAVGAIVL
ncbi:MAG: hypothetical protein QOJ68_596, partial [Blastococcus sp.]|nr:hypothetical protein [Blastococcus sp.]